MSYKTKNLKIFLLALLVAVAAAFVVKMVLFKQTGQHTSKAQDVVSVLVAKSEFKKGDKITSSYLKWDEWPRKSVQQEHITKKSEVREIEGAIVRENISRGEPLRRTDFVKAGDKGVLSALITPGKRAFTILLKRNANITPLLSPGDYVDVIVASRGRDRKEYKGKTIVEHVPVLEIDGKFEKTEKGSTKPPRSVTIEVTDEESEALAAALKSGDPTISLHSFIAGKHKRKPRQKESVAADIGAQQAAQAAQKTAMESEEEEIVVTILRGEKKEEFKYKR